jgi:drug/metabolite transporter (DMT)-like permease
MELSRNLSLVLMHLIVLIWGLTGILGHEISLDADQLVWWRVLIALVALAIFGLLKGLIQPLNWRSVGALVLCGVVVGAHWVTFFAAIKASTISVALCAISTNSFFVALMGPWFGRGPWRMKEFLLSAVVAVGLIFVFRFELRYWQGIVLGLVAAALSAFFSLANARFVQSKNAITISFWEMVGALVSITIYFFVTDGLQRIHWPSDYDMKCLLFLGVVCTAVALVVSVEVMKKLSPFTCALTINLEPIYTILIALYLYGQNEYMSWGFYVGMLCILSTLALDLYWRQRPQQGDSVK